MSQAWRGVQVRCLSDVIKNEKRRRINLLILFSFSSFSPFASHKRSVVERVSKDRKEAEAASAVATYYMVFHSLIEFDPFRSSPFFII